MKTPVEGSKKSISMDKYQIWSILGYALVMLVIGVPTWWKTTEVYRVNLPYREIGDLSSEEIKIALDVIFVTDKTSSPPQIPSSIYKISSKADSRPPTDQEKNLISKYKGGGGDLSSLDQSLANLNAHLEGTIYLYDLPDFISHEKLVIGRFRSAFYNSKKIQSSDLIRGVSEGILGESTLTGLLKTINNSPRRTHDKLDLRRTTASDSGYDVLFSLLIPQPEEQKSILGNWGIKSAIETYVDPLLDTFSNFSDFNVQSQILYLSKLNLNPVLDPSDRSYVVDPQSLGLAINPIESQLASHVSSKPRLNFLVYIPPKSISPLKIRSTETSSFMIPKWGGVMIYNNDEGKKISMDAVMSVFVSQLRLLLGIQEEIIDSNVEYLPLTQNSKSNVRIWEKEFLYRLRGLENLSLSRVTLQSLAHLLSQISNIVIVDEIGAQVEKSVAYFNSGFSSLASSSASLTEGYLDSLQSFRASEKAFFDPSLLALLYFPEDQKYAIYIPLFLPVGIPVVMSLVTIFKFWKSQSKKKMD